MSDQTPPQRIAELEDRIEQLEATTKKMMPTRRDALKFGGAAAIGAAAMSGTASAGSAQVGTIGDSNNLVDVEAEDINVSDTINGASVSGAAAGEALTSDGSGNLTFAAVGGGIVLEPGDSLTVESTFNEDELDTFLTLYSGSAKNVVGGTVVGGRDIDFMYTFSDNSTIRKNGSGTTYTTGNNSMGKDANGEFYEVVFLPPAKDVIKIEFGYDGFGDSAMGAEVLLKS